MPNFHKASSSCAALTLRKSYKEAVCITWVIASLRDSTYPGTQRSDLHSGDESNSVQVCLGASVFPRRKSKCHGGWRRQVGISETEHGPEEASSSSVAAILPSKCSLPDLRERGAWCRRRNYSVMRPPHA